MASLTPLSGSQDGALGEATGQHIPASKLALTVFSYGITMKWLNTLPPDITFGVMSLPCLVV